MLTDGGIRNQHNALNHPTAEGECSFQENIGRLHASDNVSLRANASLPSDCWLSVLAARASG